jgi:hypothetical protein
MLLSVRSFLIEFPKLPPTYGGSRAILLYSWQPGAWHQSRPPGQFTAYPYMAVKTLETGTYGGCKFEKPPGK